MITTFCSLHGQNLTVVFGSVYSPYQEKSPLHPDANDQRTAGGENFFKITYEQLLRENLFVLGSCSLYPIHTYFNFYKEGRGLGVGWVGTHVTRIDFSLMYSALPKSKFIIQPNIGLGLQTSLPNPRVRLGGDKEGFQGWIANPDVKLLEDVEGNSYFNLQIVPVIGLKFGYAFWGRLELFYDIQMVFAYKAVQDIRMSYSYKGVEQPDAINYSDGTGRLFAFGLGYRFGSGQNRY